MQEMPLVSVIVGNYNGAEIIAECLDSVLAQTYPNREVIVVDDASQDASREVIKGYREVKLLANRANRGLAACRNLGLKEARGRYIAFLDNDVVLYPDWMERMLEAARRWPRARLFASHLLLYDRPGRIDSTGGCMNLAGYAWGRSANRRDREVRDSPHVFFPCGAAMFMHRELLEVVGGFDPAYHYSYDDVELGWSAHMLGWQVIYVRDAVARHRCSYTMGSHNPRKLYFYERSRIRFMLKNLEAPLLRSVAAEVSFLYLQRMRQELCEEGLGWRERARYWGSLAGALGWNLAHLPSTWRGRRRAASMRRVSDQELIRKGLILPRVEQESTEHEAHGPSSVAGSRGEDGNGLGGSAMGEGLSLGNGWHQLERARKGPAFRWTEEEAEAVLRCDGSPGRLVIETLMAHPRGESLVEVEVNGLNLGTMVVRSQPAAHRLGLDEVRVNGSLRLRLRVADPFVPAELLNSTDQRVLGVAVTRIALE
jgi:GT2 family glycosyltransferase